MSLHDGHVLRDHAVVQRHPAQRALVVRQRDDRHREVVLGEDARRAAGLRPDDHELRPRDRARSAAPRAPASRRTAWSSPSARSASRSPELTRYSSVTSATCAIVCTAPSGNLPTRRFAAEHDRVGAVEDRVGHVAHFRPRRATTARSCSAASASRRSPACPPRWQRRIRSFWMIGTWATSISTPRSPRATIRPSLASMIASISLQRLGLFDLGDQVDVARPCRAGARAASCRSSALRTNERAR